MSLLTRLQIARGTKANLDTLAAANGLLVGELYYTTDTNKLYVGKTVSTYEAADAGKPTLIGTIAFENPVLNDKVGSWRAPVAITITKIHAVLVGSATPSVTYKLRFGTDRSAAGTAVVTAGSTVTSVTAGDDVTSFDDATIPANSWVWIEVTAQSGTVTQISVNFEYTED